MMSGRTIVILVKLFVGSAYEFSFIEYLYSFRNQKYEEARG
jgi:hypothetical protein